jgi:hypothetical protein
MDVRTRTDEHAKLPAGRSRKTRARVAPAAALKGSKYQMIGWLSYTLKATIGGIIAALGTADLAAADGHISMADGIRIALSGVTAMGVVLGVSNGPRPSSTTRQ